MGRGEGTVISGLDFEGANPQVTDKTTPSSGHWQSFGESLYLD